MVVDAAWQVIAANDLTIALLGEPIEGNGHQRNMASRHFTRAASRIVRTDQEQAAVDTEIVAALHDALGRYPADQPLAALIGDLRAASPRFAELWQAGPVKPRVASRKTFVHPEIGTITLDCDVLAVQGSDLRLDRLHHRKRLTRCRGARPTQRHRPAVIRQPNPPRAGL